MIKILKNGIVTNVGTDQEWLQKHITMGTFGENYEVVEEDNLAQLEQEKVNAEAQSFLDSSDWLIIRELETGTTCPQDVKQARAEARAKIIR